MSGSVNEMEAVKGRTLDDIEADVARAVEQLQALRAERGELPALVEEASAALDATRLEELERRARDLEARIGAGQARLHQLYAERARAQLPEAEEAAASARAEYEREHAAYLRAHARVNQLGVESDNARVRALALRQSAEENEREAREITFRLPADPRASLARQS